MWNFFRKKKEKNNASVCNHKYKDFPWYTVYGGDESYRRNPWLEIKEPYVCIKCKHREDKRLLRKEFSSIHARNAALDELQEKYSDKLMPLEQLNDMIYDMQLVDREYLDLLEEIEHPKADESLEKLSAELAKAIAQKKAETNTFDSLASRRMTQTWQY